MIIHLFVHSNKKYFACTYIVPNIILVVDDGKTVKQRYAFKPATVRTLYKPRLGFSLGLFLSSVYNEAKVSFRIAEKSQDISISYLFPTSKPRTVNLCRIDHCLTNNLFHKALRDEFNPGTV